MANASFLPTPHRAERVIVFHPAQALEGTRRACSILGWVCLLSYAAACRITLRYSPLGAQKAENTSWFPTTGGITENSRRAKEYLLGWENRDFAKHQNLSTRVKYGSLSCDLMSEATLG